MNRLTKIYDTEAELKKLLIEEILEKIKTKANLQGDEFSRYVKIICGSSHSPALGYNYGFLITELTNLYATYYRMSEQKKNFFRCEGYVICNGSHRMRYEDMDLGTLRLVLRNI